MLGQDVVDPFLSLLDAGLSGGLEHVGEEILEVVVRQILLGRDEVVLVLWIPLELVDPRETTRVQCDLLLQVSMVLREPDRLASKIKNTQPIPEPGVCSDPSWLSWPSGEALAWPRPRSQPQKPYACDFLA